MPIMKSMIPVLAVAFSLPLSVLSQATTATPAAAVPTAIVPFGTLPACAQQCGFLFDVQGACSPPHIATVDKSCFCNDSRLRPFYLSTQGVCNNACPNDQPDMLKIQQWFVSYCGSEESTSTAGAAPGTAGATATGTAGGTGTATGTAAGGATATGTTPGGTVSNGNGSWISTHYKYVIMIVVIVLAIIAGWIGGCLLRRRIHRKRDLNYELRPPGAPWLQGQKHASPYGNDGIPPAHFGRNKEAVDVTATPATSRLSKGEKKRWLPKQRT